MLTPETIDRIVEGDKSTVEDHDGTMFFVSPVKGAKALEFPPMQTVECFSLTQLISVLKDECDGDQVLWVNILGPQKVEAISPNLNGNRDHDCIAQTDFSKIFTSFPFGQQMSHEDFIINLMTKFAETPEREELLKTVASVKSEGEDASDDDGYSQTVKTKAGVSLVQNKKLKNLWNLKTYKTFPEVEQPVIPYILRLHQKGEDNPKFALYECDGGLWKVESAKKIRDYLNQVLKVELGENFENAKVL